MWGKLYLAINPNLLAVGNSCSMDFDKIRNFCEIFPTATLQSIDHAYRIIGESNGTTYNAI